MTRTVLPQYLGTTVGLALMVGVGVVAVGVPAAVLVTVFDFPGRRQFEWLLLLPLAMPAYVTAYAYTDFLQFSGPLQTWLRRLRPAGRLLPEVRSVGARPGCSRFRSTPTCTCWRAPRWPSARRS
jgi:iron(III) transport system permease protein